jgi:hypothetical protein
MWRNHQLQQRLAWPWPVGSGRATGQWNTDARGAGSVTGIGPWSRMVVQALLARWLRLGQSSAAEIEGLMSGIGGKVHYRAWNMTTILWV